MPIHDWTRVNAGIFHHFHQDWISTISRRLNAGLLPLGYYALTEQIAGGLHPDVLALEWGKPDLTDDGRNGPTGRTPSGGGMMALATMPPRVQFTATAEPDKYAAKRNRIAIRHSSGDHLIAMLEIVSPGNKGSRHALRKFVEKAVEFLDSGIHLLIVDLFPPGSRDPQGIHAAIWSEITDDDFQLPSEKPLTLAAYSAGPVKTAYVEPVAVGEALPDMPLFLESDRYVPVPLEATYQAAFDAVPRRWREVLEAPRA